MAFTHNPAITVAESGKMHQNMSTPQIYGNKLDHPHNNNNQQLIISELS